MDLPKRNETDVTAKIGVNAVSRVINNQLRWIFRPVHQEDDFGIDGYIDEVDESGGVTGRYCAVQIKTGKSYLQSSDECFWYKDTKAHLNYFLNQPSTVLLILCDPEDEVCYWTILHENLIEVSEKSWKHPIKRSQILNIESKPRIKEAIHAFERKSTGWSRAPEEISLRTDGKFEYENIVVSYDAWTMSNGVTCVKLNFSERLDLVADASIGAINAVKAYMGSVGARRNYMHALLEIEEERFRVRSAWCPADYRQQFSDFFIPWVDGMEQFTEGPQMNGKLFDWIGCNTKGTGEWSMFLFDVTAFYVPEQFDNYKS